MRTCIALGGNPNSGKTTLFNKLTGSKQHVANYPGVTVEKKEGICLSGKKSKRVVDLPGTYSLTPYSLEEVVTRNFLIDEKPDIIVNVVDASNLERNLYLTIQLLELDIPMCIALNMVDVAKKNGITIDTEKLSRMLNVPVIPIIARTNFGRTKLMEAIDKTMTSSKRKPLQVSYGSDIEEAISKIEEIIAQHKFGIKKYSPRWLAIKYLENDEEILSTGDSINPLISEQIKIISNKISTHVEQTLETYPEAMIADHRYGHISSILRGGIMRELYDKYRSSTSDRIDKILVNRLAGPIIMLLILIGLYHFTFTYSKIPVTLFSSFFTWFGRTVSNNINNEIVKSLIVSGIINGVGGVLGFVPLIMFMFFGIAIIEDSGYLARVAFMMDRVFQTFGLHGNSVMPYIISGGIAGGCAVPGVMATRSLKSPKERIATLLTVTFMSCGAKLPILTLLIAIFFNERNTEMMLLITAISWLGALLVAKLLRVTVISGEATPFVMELPPYRLPTFKGLLIHTWERTWQYIKKAGTIILGVSVVLWVVMTFPKLSENQLKEYDDERKAILATVNIKNQNIHFDQDFFNAYKLTISKLNAKQSKEALLNSIAGRVGIKIEKMSKWAGFDWRTNIALLGGFAAKEVIISTLGTAYSLEDTNSETNSSLSQVLKSEPGWKPLSALSLIIFVMFYSPCSATVICIIKETSLKWGIFSIIFNTSLAFLLSVLTFQVGSLLGY